MRHRLERGDAETLAMRGAGDDCRPRVELRKLRRRNEPTRHRHPLTERPVARDDESEVRSGLDQLEDPLLRGKPACVEDLGRPRLPANLGREVDAARHDLDLPGAKPRRLPRQRRRGAYDRLRPSKNGARQGRRSARECNVRPPQLDDERPAGRHRREPRRDPVRVHEVGVARRPPRRPCVGGQKRRDERRAPRPATEIADDPRAVREAEVRERRRRDDLDVRAGRPQPLDRVRHEAARRIRLRARVRRCEDDDLHAVVMRRPNTTGSARASIARA